MSEKENLDNQQPDDEAGLYVISVAAELSGLHPTNPSSIRSFRFSLTKPHRRSQSSLFIARYCISAHGAALNW